uniref:Uncharacterized protein n=1 Tax=Ascaris lumbricoides TaxID=6252 RepID=A0A0M3IBS8_ASCLU
MSRYLHWATLAYPMESWTFVPYRSVVRAKLFPRMFV